MRNILAHPGRPTAHCPCLVTDIGLMQLNLRERTAKPLYKHADIACAIESHEPQSLKQEPSTAPKPAPTIVVRTADQIIILSPSGRELQVFPLPADVKDSNMLWFQLADDKALVQSGEDLYWIQPGGKIVRHEHDASLGSPPRSAIRKALDDTLFPSVIVPSPGAIFVALAFKYWDKIQDPSLNYFTVLGWALQRAWQALVLTSLISIALAWLTYCRQRRYGLPWTGVWTTFVLLFGLPAYLGYLAHRSWPARLACPGCGKLAPRDRPACFSCGTEFPPPAPKGIEVFA